MEIRLVKFCISEYKQTHMKTGSRFSSKMLHSELKPVPFVNKNYPDPSSTKLDCLVKQELFLQNYSRIYCAVTHSDQIFEPNKVTS